ncbi:aldehyde dehydrogenase-like protein [Massariosphaeria phaeospora]|uniref:aldehyde dehydrogenase (NAD(+)) n=1 Tax=Massariosphaeria phaeospora TaxID=100035 RepID=A0A7C8I5Q5_9PLEO|nr:aldehyde dehydrogenase-like protein [Massariosphaeria phaeospora]
MSPSKVSILNFDNFYNIVDGKRQGSKTFHHGVDPATGQKLWDVPIANEQDLDSAVTAAKEAFPAWSDTPIEKRKDFQGDWQAGLNTASFDIGAAAGFMAYHCGLKIPEEETEDDEKTIYTEYTPLGVCAGIVSWNFPLILSAGKIAPALLTGNTIIIKPSPFTQYSGLKLVELGQDIFPPDVLQAVGGNEELGALMATHPDIAKISFTGSIATGKKVMAASAKTLKRVTLELGGNDACIILPDVDIKKVAPEVVMGAFLNSGQVCIATKRIYVHESIYKEFLLEMVTFTKTNKIGSPDDGDNLVGPMQNAMQYEKVKDFFADSKAQGYKFAAGNPDNIPSSSAGFFIPPAIVDNPPNDSCIIAEEPFGPIVPTQPWCDLDEVIARANNTTTGLGACVWAADVDKAMQIARRLEAGSVFVNSYEKATPLAIFGGHKESGIGGSGARRACWLS